LRSENKRAALAALAFFFLFTGGLIYLCFRPANILLFRWLDWFGINYSIFQNVPVRPPGFVINNLPNVLFLLFGYLFVFVIWDNNKACHLFYVLVITALTIAYEIATRDIDDIIAVVITFIVYLFVYNKFLAGD
jgi:hypothetical protein